MGRPQFAAAGTNGGGQTIATQSRPEVEAINSDRSTTVAAGTSETVEIYAPTGSNYEVRGSTIQVPAAGGTTGNHTFEVRTAGRVMVLRGRSGYQDEIRFEMGHWRTAPTSALPSDQSTAKQIENSLRATENSPLEITYDNSTDADQTDTRIIRYTVEEVSY